MSGTLSDMMSRALWRQLMQQNTSGGFQGWSPGAGFGLPGQVAPQVGQQTTMGAAPAAPMMRPAGAGSVIDHATNQNLYGTANDLKLGILGSFGFPIAYDPRLLGRARRGFGSGSEGNQAGDHAGDPSGPEGPGGGGLA